MNKLAISGGPKVRTRLFPNQDTFTTEEKDAVLRVFANGRPSGYRANKGFHFYGGTEVQAFEKEFAETICFDLDHVAIACNSATSGLFIACAAIDLKQGDEVIVTPYSMTCSATIPAWFGAKPIFADVEAEYFCIDPNSIADKITKKTKAIIAVDLFGQPCNYSAIKQIIRYAEARYGHKIYLVTDTAQAPGASYTAVNFKGEAEKAQPAGAIGDLGVFSFNFGKHMTCGEGGMILVSDPELAMRCRLIMNHAESVVNDHKEDNFFIKTYKDLLGLNLRMTEFQAAIAREQLKKLNSNINTRIHNVNFLNKMLSEIPVIKLAQIREHCKHSYYVSAYLWDEDSAGIHRDEFIEAVSAELMPREGRDGEGVQIGCGYIRPINLMPWNKNKVDHLPVVEDLWKNRLFLTLYHAPNSGIPDMHDVGEAFLKVWRHWDNNGSLS